MPDFPAWLQHAAEVVKIAGGLASFYAVYKLRQIEKKYLFKATLPEMIVHIRRALDDLSSCIPNPSQHRPRIIGVLNHLIVDVQNIKRKSRGDSLRTCNELLAMLAATRPPRYFWQPERPMLARQSSLIDIYGKGMGLVRSLENDVNDMGWSGK